MATDTSHSRRTASEQSFDLGRVRRGSAGVLLLGVVYLGAQVLMLLVATAVAIYLAAFLPAGAVGVVGFVALGLGAVAAAPAVTRHAFAALGWGA